MKALFALFMSLVRLTGSQIPETCNIAEFVVAIGLSDSGHVKIKCATSVCPEDQYSIEAPVCSFPYQSSCYRPIETLAGTRIRTDIFDPLKLRCCESRRILTGKSVKLVFVRQGSAYRTKAFVNTKGQYVAFEVIKNIRRDFNIKGVYGITAEIVRLVCRKPPKPEPLRLSFQLDSAPNSFGANGLGPSGPGSFGGGASGFAPAALAPALLPQGCFAEDVQIETLSGRKPVSELQIEDYVLSVVSGEPAWVKVTSFLHKAPDQLAKFQKISLADGGEFLLTPYHFVFATPCENNQYVPSGKSLKYAKDLTPAIDCLVSVKSGAILSRPIKIQNNSDVYKRGVYSPMTENGVIVANGYMVSCHSVVRHDSLMKSLFFVQQKIQMAVDWFFGEGHGKADDVELPWPVKFAFDSTNFLLNVANFLPTEKIEL